MADPLYRPSPDRLAGSAYEAFRKQAEDVAGRPLDTPSDLHAFSVAQSGAFWRLLWDFAGVIGEAGERDRVNAGEMPGARFFPDGTLSFAQNLLRHRGDATALVCCDETGRYAEWSRDALRLAVGGMQAALRDAGVTRGDRVAAFLPNGPHAIITMLASNALGATYSSCSPDFGAKGVLDRFGQIEPKVLVACDAYRYGGKRFSCIEKLREVTGSIDSLERVVMVSPAGETEDANGIAHVTPWDDFVDTPREPEYLALPFDHPLYVLYSSGTTGQPKCIVHGQGGTLLQHLKEQRLHLDLREEERFFYFTTCGWMMWNWLVTGLASGATLVLYDGSPFHPSGHAMFELAAREGIEVFGTSAKFIDAVQKAGLRPGHDHDLSKVRAVLSTGSPLSADAFDFVYDAITPAAQLASISGGTDIVSCFVLGHPALPVHRGEIQAPGLGMDVAVFDDEGEEAGIDEQGELVCRNAFPSMPVGFWNDDDGARYRAAYFERFPGVWTHGDFTRKTDHGGYVISGRSDAVLNPGGVRIGTAEIYRPVERLAEVKEAVVIGQPWEDDVRVVLFVVPADGVTLDDALVQRIRKTVRENASPRHVPSKVLSVPDIPRTRSGKISELTVKRLVMGQPPKNVEALANPEALAHFADRPELSR